MKRGTVSDGDLRLVSAERKAGAVELTIIPEIGARAGRIYLSREECRELAYVLRAVAE